ncbi:MAG: hypothetical protein B9S32_06055 [Verrucomicrobia bacterium Tous-C9LFEB]|nr:MAG: hypothetical protein B9S32_06055 [Verrucomicrobia bacterium Tous-C9LFEB]
MSYKFLLNQKIAFFVLFIVTIFSGGKVSAAVTVYPDDARISYSDYVRLTFVDSPFDASRKLARFDRMIPMAGTGYNADNPGARIRFRTDATSIQVQLYYNSLHISTTARNSIGFYLVDGVGNAAWTFKTVATTTVRAAEQVTVTVVPGAAGSFHDYEFIMPYGDSVDLQAVVVNDAAQFSTPTARSSIRYLAYGDSVTQGFTATDCTKGYAYLVAQQNNWQVVNLGMAGRAGTSKDGEDYIGQRNADIISVCIGVNDWQAGYPSTAARYQTVMTNFFNYLRAIQPNVPIYAITPLWVDPLWVMNSTEPLENYRQSLRNVVAARQVTDRNIYLVEGPSLIDNSVSYFDTTRVHPNNAGFAQMASRLAAIMAAKPAVVTGLTAKPGTVAGQVILNWSAAAGAGSYVIERSSTSGSGFAPIGQVTVPTLTFTDGGNRTASPLYYRIRSLNPGGSAAASAEASSLAYLPAGIDGWRYVNYGTTNSTDSLAADLAMPHGDGIPNLMAYALGLSATVANRPDSLPAAEQGLVAGVPYFTYTFTHSKGAIDVTVVVEAANDPAGPWTAINPFLSANQVGVSDNTPSTGIETIVVKDTQPLSAASRRFMRLRVTRQ